MSILQHSALRAFLKRHSDDTATERPLAVFDCDGTVIKGDIGEAMLYYQIEKFLFRTSPALIWTDHPDREQLDHLYSAIIAAKACDRTASPEFAPFATMILDWYFGQIDNGKVEKACGDIVRLFAGYSLAEVRQIAEETFTREFNAPLTDRALGGRVVPRGARFIVESVDIIRRLLELGFEIWAVSGSNKWSVESVFQRLNIPPQQVIGIELKTVDGILTPEVVEPVPIREKKVESLQGHTAGVPILVASDSKNDIPLLLYSSDLKMRVNSRNRDTEDFFRTARSTPDESWINIETPTIAQ